MAAQRCTTCKKRPADVIDDANGKPVCTGCWLKKYPNG